MAIRLVSICQLWSNGAITQETLLGALKKGEILPDVDVEEEVELTGQEKLDNMLIEMRTW